jgi:hypothetical protein
MAERMDPADVAPDGAPNATLSITLTAPPMEARDADYQAAVASQKKARKEADAATARAEQELANREKCLVVERAARESQTMKPTTVTKARELPQSHEIPPVTNGDPVNVVSDLTPGVNSYGGTGWVAVHEDKKTKKRSYSVAYDENWGGHTERNVALSRLTVRDLGPVFLPTPKPKRACTERVPPAPVNPQPPKPRCLLEALAHGDPGWEWQR